MDSPSYDVRREDGRYVIALDAGEAELVFHRSGERMIITHTEVPAALEGRGIAAVLVRAAIGDARAEGLKVVPRCSYVAAQFRRHPAWSDLLA